MDLASYFLGGESGDSPHLLVEEIGSQSLRDEMRTPRSNHQDCLFLLLDGGGGNSTESKGAVFSE